MNCRVAVLVDADNVNAEQIEFAVAEAERRGVVTIRRAFGRTASIAARETLLGYLGFGAEAALPRTMNGDKSTADLLLAQFAVQIAERRAVDLVVIVSSDSDFAALANGLGATGVPTLCIGRVQAPLALKNAASHFIAFPGPSVAPPSSPTVSGSESNPTVKAKGPPTPADFAKVCKVIRDNADKNGEAKMSPIGQHLNSAFSGNYQKFFGVATLTRLIEQMQAEFAVVHVTRNEKKVAVIRDLKHKKKG